MIRMKVCSMLTLLAVFVTCAYVTNAQPLLVGNSSGSNVLLPSSELFSIGDPRRCMEAARRNGLAMERFEVLPGFGWDNLRNENEGQVVSFNYSQCRTTDDGRFLLPDSVSAVPIKDSRVQIFAELISHWANWTSSTSQSINADAGLDFMFVSVSAKFSADFEECKSKQVGDKTMTTRAQLRYIRYHVQLEPDAQLHPVFKARVMAIAAALGMGNKEQATYLSQLLVRDFGTHIITKAKAGAALEQVDQIDEKFVQSNQDKKKDIMASASMSLFGVFHMSTSYETKTDDAFAESYQSSRSSSNIVSRGGPVLLPANFTANMWAAQVDSNLVALDRSGDPLHFRITPAALPELPASTLNEVYNQVQEAVLSYYDFNRIPGCVDPKSPLYSPSANVDDGMCELLPVNVTFGGMFQTCNYNSTVCTMVNPLTGGYSCPDGYRQVKLASQRDSPISFTKRECFRILPQICLDVPYTVYVDYELYWCVKTGSVALQYTGYLFGGLYTANIKNSVTGANSCPPNFITLIVPTDERLRVCVSDRYELTQQYALPFAGFFSCDAGNPLAVSESLISSQPQPDGKFLTLLQYQEAKELWPQRCPGGHNRLLATVYRGCQIYYCVQSGAGPVIPPIKRPPFIPAPKVTDSVVASIVFDNATKTWKPMSDLVSAANTSIPNAKLAPSMPVFDPATKTWKPASQLSPATSNNAVFDPATMSWNPAASMQQSAGSSSQQNSTSSGTSMSPGTAAGITFGAMLGVILVAAVALLTWRIKKYRPGFQSVHNDS